MLSSLIASALLLSAQQATTPAEAPLATQAPRATAASPRVDPATLPLPAGAPADDFGLVSWCQGALRGHLDLAERIKDTLPLDDAQQSIGRDYLQTYAAALAAAPQSRTARGQRASKAAHDKGYAGWASARNDANRDTQVYTYLGWQLPGRCEHAAAQLVRANATSAARR